MTFFVILHLARLALPPPSPRSTGLFWTFSSCSQSSSSSTIDKATHRNGPGCWRTLTQVERYASPSPSSAYSFHSPKSKLELTIDLGSSTLDGFLLTPTTPPSLLDVRVPPAHTCFRYCRHLQPTHSHSRYSHLGI